MSSTETGSGPAASAWESPEVARSWAQGDGLGELLALPRRMVAELAAAEPGRPITVMDVGSGPGDFLGHVLDRLPDAVGIWTDLSAEMEVEGRRRLARFGNRVRYATVPLDRLDEVAEPGGVDLIVTSRVTHHLDGAALQDFYTSAGRLLAPGGWLANLDHVSSDSPWLAALRSVRDRLYAPNPSPHRHLRPAPTLDDHLSAIRSAALSDPSVLWSAFWTVLVVARRSVA